MEEMKSNDVYLDSDGTLGISADVDISKVRRILLTQEGTHYGSMYYLDDSDHNSDTEKTLGNNSEMPNSCSFKPGDKFILEIGKRQLDEFEIAGTDYYIKIYLLKMLAPYNPEQNTETRRVVAVGDVVYRQAAIDALDEYIEEYSSDLDENGYHNPKWCAMQEARMTIQRLPAAQPKRTQERTETHACDSISRQQAIDAIVNTVSKIGLHDNSEVARYGATFRQHEIIDIIEGVPSAQPERNTGEWIKVKRCEEDTQPNLKCPFCGNIVGWFDLAKYCAGGGAKLEGGAG